MSNQEKKLGNVGSASCFALALAVIGFFALLTGKVDGSGTVLFGIWLIGGALIHIIMGITAIFTGDDLDSNAFIFFGSILMFVSGACLIVKWIAVVNGISIDSSIEGYLWIPLWFAIWLWTPAVLKLYPAVMALGLLPLNIGFPIVSLVNLGVMPPTMLPIAGYSFGLVALVFLYLGGAFILNPTFKKSILPIGTPIIKS